MIIQVNTLNGKNANAEMWLTLFLFNVYFPFQSNDEFKLIQDLLSNKLKLL